MNIRWLEAINAHFDLIFYWSVGIFGALGLGAIIWLLKREANKGPRATGEIYTPKNGELPGWDK